MRYAVIAVAVALSVVNVAAAQAPAVSAGMRVRVTAPQAHLKNQVTTVTEARGDSLTLSVRGGHRTVAVSDITSLEISTGQRRRVVVDALLGFGAGAIAGGIIGAATYEECEADGFGIIGCAFLPQSRGHAATEGAIFLGAAGLVTGAIVGIFHRTDVWQRKLPVSAAIRPSGAGGVSVSLSRAF